MPNLETGKDKDRKNSNIDSCYSNNLSLAYFSKKNFFNKNLLEVDNIIDDKLSNNENKKELILASEKAK